MMDDELNMVESLKQQCMDLQEQLSELQAQYDEAIKELDDTKMDLQKKIDLCTMYEHIIDSRNETLAQMDKESRKDGHKIDDLESTIDMLAGRIAKLKEQ